MSKLHLFPPIYLLFSHERCYRCGADAPVVALACKKFSEAGDADASESDDEEPILVSDTVEMPATLLAMILALHPHYEKRHSRMAGIEYFMNICPHCRAHFGDFSSFQNRAAHFPRWRTQTPRQLRFKGFQSIGETRSLRGHRSPRTSTGGVVLLRSRLHRE